MMWISFSSCKFLLKELCSFLFLTNVIGLLMGFFFFVDSIFLANGLLATVVRQLEKSEH